MAANRFPKQGTEAYFVFSDKKLSVVRVKITKKWIDKEAYLEPTQVATVRVVKVFGSPQYYNKGSKIIIDDPEDLIPSERKVVENIFN